MCEYSNVLCLLTTVVDISEGLNVPLTYCPINKLLTITKLTTSADHIS